MNVPLHSRSTQAAEGLRRRLFTVAEVTRFRGYDKAASPNAVLSVSC
jgi:hypothetical protein